MELEEVDRMFGDEGVEAIERQLNAKAVSEHREHFGDA